MSKIAEVMWQVANDADARKSFDASFAPDFIARYGQELSDEEREALVGGNTDAITGILTKEGGILANQVSNTNSFAMPDEEEIETPEEPSEVEPAEEESN